MQLSPISLAITRLGGVRFSPSALFSSGEQGAWYDPSDFGTTGTGGVGTLFQDSAGTTPVTAVEQPVGLVLDKSKGLVLGSELVVSPYSGTTSGSWAVSATSVTRNSSAAGQASVNLGAAISTSKYYLVTFVVSNLSGDDFFFRIGAGGTAYRVSANGTYTARVVGGGTSSSILFAPWAGSAGEATITNISVRELPGNHAYQTTSASRPTLRARYNLLTYSEQFDNGIWLKSELNTTGTPPWVNVAVSPDGTTTADSLIASGVNALHLLYQDIVSAITTYTFSVYAKSNGYRIVLFTNNGGSNNARGFDLSNGTTFANTSGYTEPLSHSITSVGNGWYRCSITFQKTSSISCSFGYWLNNGTSDTFAGNGTSGVYVWGAQLVPTAVFPSNTYQQITTATSYATGAAFPPYLFFDGVDDSLLTNSVDFSATDKMTVWAGVTKSSDAASGVLTELSSDVSVNAGSFYAAVPESALIRYSIISRGNATLNANQRADTTSNTYLAPITNVLTGTFNISGDSNILRLNGAQVSQATGDQGTGNFGNYPLYIGRRNNATVPLNGNIYSLIIRGAQSTAAQISSTESWVAAKTPLGSL